MGKNPSTIFRELYKVSKDRSKKAESIGGTNHIIEMEKQDGCYYVPYKEVVSNFLVEGYSERIANVHIDKWVDYDLLFIRYSDGFKYIGFNKKGF
jgi:hypothetical protein